MTLPSERSRSLRYTREFLRDLLDPKKTPRIPKGIRQRAYMCLRHYPWDSDIAVLAKTCPDILTEPESRKE